MKVEKYNKDSKLDIDVCYNNLIKWFNTFDDALGHRKYSKNIKLIKKNGTIQEYKGYYMICDKYFLIFTDKMNIIDLNEIKSINMESIYGNILTFES